uniref:Uncharacterized protein n=1 Tax=Anopheles coluzzii TaxID=1518534 RepID=A0A8W7P1K3_ANOCL
MALLVEETCAQCACATTKCRSALRLPSNRTGDPSRKVLLGVGLISEQALLVREQTVHVTLELGRYSPGASEVPASSDPIITADAPSDSAFTMCPIDCMPPSAMTGTPYWRARLHT